MGLVRRAVGASVALVAIAALVACSGAQHVNIAATPAGMRAAAQATLEHAASGGRLTIKMDVGGRSATITGDAQIDSRQRIISMHLDMGDYVSPRASDLPPSIASSLRDMQIVVTPATLYMHLPALPQAMGSPAQWIKFDFAAQSSGLTDLLGSSSAFTSDPTAVVRLLQGATAVEKAGREKVGAVKATHFRGTYTMRDAIDETPADQKDVVQRLVNGFDLPDRALDAPIAFDTWIDDDGLIRRFHTFVDLPALTGNHSTSAVDSDVELTGFGQTVHIDVPNDADVYDASSLSSSSPSSSAGSAVN